MNDLVFVADWTRNLIDETFSPEEAKIIHG